MTDTHEFSTWQAIGRLEGEERERSDRVMARATEVFGNEITAGVWASRFSETIRGGPGQIRDRIRTAEGAEDALAELEQLSLTVIPRLYQVPKRPRRR